MKYEWNENLECGYEEIDNQHKQLIETLNKLMKASSEGKSEKVVLETLDFLTGYSIKHFEDEENLQIKYNYPDYIHHKQIHDEFKNVVGELIKKVQKEGPTIEIIDIVSSTMGAWLLTHIKGDDFHMAGFIKSRL